MKATNGLHWILLRCFLLALLFRSSTQTQLIKDTIDVNNGPDCNKTVEVDNRETLHILNSQNGNCTGASNQSKCIVTYRGATDFIRNAYVLCGFFQSVMLLNCKTTLQIGQSIRNGNDSKVVACSTYSRPLEYCSPPTKDLQVGLESNDTCAKDAFLGYIPIRLDYAFPHTFRFDTEDECPQYARTLYKENGTIMSQFRPDWDVTQNLCKVEIHPIFDIYKCIEFCIEFVDHEFVSGGAGMKIEIDKLLDSTMIFNSSKAIPTGQICKRWHVTTSIKVIIVPGKDPVKKHQHAVLFHYSFNVKKGDHNWDGKKKHKGIKPFQIVFIVTGVIVLTVLIYCCKRCMMVRRRDDDSSDAEPGSIPPPVFEDPPSYPSIIQSNFELEGRASSSPANHPGPALQEPAPPEYSILFPDKKY